MIASVSINDFVSYKRTQSDNVHPLVANITLPDIGYVNDTLSFSGIVKGNNISVETPFALTLTINGQNYYVDTFTNKSFSIPIKVGNGFVKSPTVYIEYYGTFTTNENGTVATSTFDGSLELSIN